MHNIDRTQIGIERGIRRFRGEGGRHRVGEERWSPEAGGYFQRG